MSSILVRLQRVVEAQRHLYSLKADLIKEFKESGGSWQELAVVCKISAIKYARETTHKDHDLHVVKAMVDAYVAQVEADVKKKAWATANNHYLAS